jgi:cysteine desulfurase
MRRLACVLCLAFAAFGAPAAKAQELLVYAAASLTDAVDAALVERIVRELSLTAVCDELEAALRAARAMDADDPNDADNKTCVDFVEAEAILLLLDGLGICASSGSACLADSPDPSHVIAAMKPGDAARQCVRFSLSTETHRDQVNITVQRLRELIQTLSGTR